MIKASLIKIYMKKRNRGFVSIDNQKNVYLANIVAEQLSAKRFIEKERLIYKMNKHQVKKRLPIP